MSSSGQYKGYVSYASDTNTYTVSFYNTDYMANKANYDDLESWKKPTVLIMQQQLIQYVANF